MIDRTHMEHIVQAYIDGFAAGDGDALGALFAEDATVEDPVGSAAIRGRVAITDFYRNAVATGAQLTLLGPVRAAGDSVAFAFAVDLQHEGGAMRIDVIDTFRFDADGKIAAMRAHWDDANVHPATANETTA